MSKPVKDSLCGNILLVGNWESDVGYAWWLMENYWVRIAGHFAERGARSFLIYPKVGKLPPAIAESSIEVHELPWPDKRKWRHDALLAFVREHAIRNIYLSDAPDMSPMYARLRIAGVRRIVVHDHTPGDRPAARGLRRLVKTLYKRLPWLGADRYIATTEFVRRRFIETACLPPGKCAVAPNGIVPFERSGADREYARRVFDIPPGRVVVVTTGRAAFYKGIDFFIDCAEQLVHGEGLDSLHFLFCGDGPDMAAFQALVARYGLQSHFTFAGRREDVKPILLSCDIGFHASKGEVGYSLSILEYMSAGLATIVPDRPSTSGATRHGETGLVYAAENREAACAAIRQCLDADFRQALGNAAAEAVQIQFSLEGANQALLRILEEVIV